MSIRLRTNLLGAFLAVCFLFLDLRLPLGIAAGMLYVIVVLVSMNAMDRHATILAGAICTLLIWIGYIFSKPLQVAPWIAITNRLQSLIALWSVTVLVLQRIAQTQKIHHLSRQLINLQENERSRIARDLHDVMGQELVGLKFGIGNLRELIPKASHFRLVEQERHLNAAIQIARQIAHGLSPAYIEAIGLPGALRELLSMLGKGDRLRITSELKALDAMPFNNEMIHIYRIVQEAIVNILRHSRATEAFVTASSNQQHWTIRIGASATPSKEDQARIASGSGLGIRIMQERAALLSGHLRIRTDSGVEVVLTIPRTASFIRHNLLPA